MNWLIEDYKRRCFNLLVSLNRNIDKPKRIEDEIRANVKRIMSEDKCNQLTALKTYKQRLFRELCNVSQKTTK